MTEAGAAESLVGTACGPYRILSQLGAGAMGTVYLAQMAPEPATEDSDVQDPEELLEEGGEGGGGDRRVALKLLHSHLLNRKGFFTRFRREAEAGRQVTHENVVRTLDCDLLMVNGRLAFFLVMEYAEGRTLRSLQEELGQVPEGLLREIALQTSAGLAAIHAEGIVHRDVKPENVLLAADQRVRIMDLGVAKFDDTSLTVTLAGKLAGSLPYVAPEAIRHERAGPAADLYALGVMLYELATGANPFRRRTPAGVMYAHLHHEAPLAAPLSPFLGAVVQTLLAKSPDDRFPSAAALHRVLIEAEKSGWWLERREDTGVANARGLSIPVRRATRLYGRETERAELGTAWERARQGAGGLVLVEGEAGIGKTRLIDSFARDAARDGAVLLYGAYAPVGGPDALAAAIVDHLGEDRLEEELGWILDEIHALVPAFAALVRGLPPPPGEAPLDHGAVQKVWCTLLEACARDRPLVWIVEDLHFAEAESRRVVLAMARKAQAHRVLVVATTRAALGASELAELGRLPRFARLELSRLDEHDVIGLLHDAFRNRDLAQRLGPRIARNSDGVPFFVCEMIRGLCERRFLSWSDEGRLEQARAIDRIAIPDAVRDLIEVRLVELTPEERTILDAGAVQGFLFEPDVIAQVLGLRRVTVLQDVARMERRFGVVREEERRVRFDHHLVQEVLYNGLSPNLRAEYHALVAEALDEEHEPAAVVRHHLLGRHPQRAASLIVSALAQLAGRHQHEQLIETAELALSAEPPFDERTGIEIRRRLAVTLTVLGRWRDAAALFEECLLAAEGLGDDALRLRALVDLGAQHAMRQQHGPGARRLAEALFLARRRDDAPALARALTSLGMIRATQGRTDRALRCHERALELARQRNERRLEGISLVNIANHRLALGRPSLAQAAAEEAIEALHGHQAAEIAARANLIACHRYRGEIRRARSLAEDALQSACALGFRHGEAVLTLERAGCARLRGRRDAAGRLYDRVLRIAHETRDRPLEARARAERGEWLWETGRAADALKDLAWAARRRARLGDARGAGETWVRWRLGRAEIGDLAGAEEHVHSSRAFLVQPAYDAALGRLMELQGRLDEARARYSAAVERWDERACTVPLLGALVRLAEVELLRGRESEARMTVDRSREVMESHDVRLYRGHVHALGACVGSDPAAAIDGVAASEPWMTAGERVDAFSALLRATGDSAFRREVRAGLESWMRRIPPDWRAAFAVLPRSAAILSHP